MTPLRYKNVPGFSCTIFRKNFNQIFSQGGLWDSADSMYTGIQGAERKRGDASWVFHDGEGKSCGKVTFAHIERYEDTEKWQGSQICELCCEVSEDVLMADGTYKRVEDIAVGDVVMTLNGAQRIVAVGEEKEKECVELKTADGRKQVQSTDHEFLTIYGWKSYDSIVNSLHKQDNSDKACGSILCRYKDKFAAALQWKGLKSLMLHCKKHSDLRQKSESAEGFLLDNRNRDRFLHMSRAFRQSLTCESIQCCFEEVCDLCSVKNNQVLPQLLCNRCLDLQQARGACQEKAGLRDLLDFSVCKARRGLDKDSGLSAGLIREPLRRILSRLLPEFHERVPWSARRAFSNTRCAGDTACAQTSTEQLNCRKNYLSCIHLCDEQAHQFASIDQDGVLQLSGVVRHIPMDLPFCDEGKVPKCIHRGIRYAHPYTGSSILSEEIQLFLDSISVTPCGKKVLEVSLLKLIIIISQKVGS